MKLILLALTFIFSTHTFATEATTPDTHCMREQNSDGTMTIKCTEVQKVNLKMELSLNGKMVSNPRIIARMNEMASISQKSTDSEKELIIEVLPSQAAAAGPEGILMNFKVGQKVNGKINWFSTPQILGRHNQEAEITVSSNNAKAEYPAMSLKVLPVLQ